jgi:hypothetical protein
VIVGWVIEKRFKLYVLCCLLFFVSLSMLDVFVFVYLVLTGCISSYRVVSLSTLMSV